MQKRRISREKALQFLYQYDTSLESKDFSDSVFRDKFDLFMSTFEDEQTSPDVNDFTVILTSGTCQHLEAIDRLIEQFSQNWKISRISKIERNILRVSVYEMVYLRTIPPPVTINEAIEIAKKFGSEESGSFINGILDRIKKAIEEGDLQYD